jgi:hypothetical protein
MNRWGDESESSGDDDDDDKEIIITTESMEHITNDHIEELDSNESNNNKVSSLMKAAASLDPSPKENRRDKYIHHDRGGGGRGGGARGRSDCGRNNQGRISNRNTQQQHPQQQNKRGSNNNTNNNNRNEYVDWKAAARASSVIGNKESMNVNGNDWMEQRRLKEKLKDQADKETKEREQKEEKEKRRSQLNALKEAMQRIEQEKANEEPKSSLQQQAALLSLPPPSSSLSRNNSPTKNDNKHVVQFDKILLNKGDTMNDSVDSQLHDDNNSRTSRGSLSNSQNRLHNRTSGSDRRNLFGRFANQPHDINNTFDDDNRNYGSRHYDQPPPQTRSGVRSVSHGQIDEDNRRRYDDDNRSVSSHGRQGRGGRGGGGSNRGDNSGQWVRVTMPNSGRDGGGRRGGGGGGSHRGGRGTANSHHISSISVAVQTSTGTTEYDIQTSPPPRTNYHNHQKSQIVKVLTRDTHPHQNEKLGNNLDSNNDHDGKNASTDKIDKGLSSLTIAAAATAETKTSSSHPDQRDRNRGRGRDGRDNKSDTKESGTKSLGYSGQGRGSGGGGRSRGNPSNSNHKPHPGRGKGHDTRGRGRGGNNSVEDNQKHSQEQQPKQEQQAPSQTKTHRTHIEIGK